MENRNYSFIDPTFFDELVTMQETFTDNKEEDSSQFLSFHKDTTLGTKVLKAKNFVGILEGPSGNQLEILPKIHDAKQDMDVEKTRKIFLKMLRYLEDFPGKHYDTAQLRTEQMPLYEIFIKMYLDEVQQLLRKGLKSAYRTVEANQPFYKGKLMVSHHIRSNLAHRERFYVAYDEFLLDRPENRLIKATLIRLATLSRNDTNIREAWQQLAHFEQVRPSVHYAKDFARVVSDRTTTSYESLLAWSRVFLENRSFVSFAGNQQAKTLLFPMEQVFEDYVGKNLRRYLAQGDTPPWTTHLQDKGHWLFRRKFSIRPDIVLKEGKETKFILDTKWKVLKDDSRNNYGISQSDMYQMYAYGKKYGVRDIILLYPLAEGLSNGMDISYESDDNVRVQVFFIDLSRDIKSSMEELVGLLTSIENEGNTP